MQSPNAHNWFLQLVNPLIIVSRTLLLTLTTSVFSFFYFTHTFLLIFCTYSGTHFKNYLFIFLFYFFFTLQTFVFAPFHRRQEKPINSLFLKLLDWLRCIKGVRQGSSLCVSRATFCREVDELCSFAHWFSFTSNNRKTMHEVSPWPDWWYWLSWASLGWWWRTQAGWQGWFWKSQICRRYCSAD